MRSISYPLPERTWFIKALGILLCLFLFTGKLSVSFASGKQVNLTEFQEEANIRQKVQKYRFRNITVSDELSSFRVNSIIQDKYGFMWFGTAHGLDHFDGNNYNSFRFLASDTNSLPSNNVSFLLPGSEEDIIWVGTRGGICYIDIKTFDIKRIDLGPNNDIRALYRDQKNIIWIGTQNGLLKFDETTFDYSVYNTSNSNISHNQIRSFYKDESENLWVGTLDKLNILEQKTNKFKSFDLKGNYGMQDQNNLILAISPYSERTDSLLWVGTETGLCLFNRYTHKYKVYRRTNGKVISNNKVSAIHLYDSGKIWVGTDFGLNLFDVKNEKSEFFYHNPFDPGSLSNNKIWSIYEDRAGIVWFATHNGVSLYDKNQKPFVFHPVNFQLDGQLIGSQINDIIPDEDNNLWLATQQGVFRYSS